MEKKKLPSFQFKVDPINAELLKNFNQPQPQDMSQVPLLPFIGTDEFGNNISFYTMDHDGKWWGKKNDSTNEKVGS